MEFTGFFVSLEVKHQVRTVAHCQVNPGYREQAREAVSDGCGRKVQGLGQEVYR